LSAAPDGRRLPGAHRRSLADFTVELDVYSGPYEWLLALILKEEVEIFEVPLRELVDRYVEARAGMPGAPADPLSDPLDRDTDFVGSAAALVLLKSRTLLPVPEDDALEDEVVSPEALAARLETYMKIRAGAEHLGARLAANAGTYPTAHAVRPRPGDLRIPAHRIEVAARRAFSRVNEPAVDHLGTITVTLQELGDLIRDSLARGPVSFEDLTRNMDRLRFAVAFAAALALAHEGSVSLFQAAPLGPLTLQPLRPAS
jgi:segregation and condensation protein A